MKVGISNHEYPQSSGDFVEIVDIFLVTCSQRTGGPVTQLPGYGNLWYAVADTVHGQIPAKARTDLPMCWYTFGGKEIEVKADFVVYCPEQLP